LQNLHCNVIYQEFSSKVAFLIYYPAKLAIFEEKYILTQARDGAKMHAKFILKAMRKRSKTELRHPRERAMV